jgi:hypothetical protein
MGTESQQKKGSLLKNVAIIAVTVFVVWIILTRMIGEHGTKRLVSAVAHTPITLKDEVENINATSWKALPLGLTYTGTLNLSVDVVRGNPIDIYVISSDDLEKIKNNQQFNHFTNFMATKTKVYKRSARLEKGNYYLVLRDDTLGILSASSSDVKVVAQLEP